jgi:hypothetical protein
MKKYYYILLLSIIFTAYLFSQTEENEIVKVDTVIKIDTIIVIKVDTIVVAKPVSKQEEKTNLSNYIYHDTLAIDDCQKTGIISAKLGSLIFINIGSVTLDIPITCKLGFAAKGFYEIRSISPRSGFGLGLGYVHKYVTDDIIIKGNVIYPFLGLGVTKNKTRFGLNVGGDIIFSNIFSVGLDFTAFEKQILPFLTVGLNILY